MDLNTAYELQRLEEALYRFQPGRQWVIRTVTFPSTQETDLDIAHSLTLSNPERVSFKILQANAPVLVWKDLSPTRIPWSQGIIRLRCTTPSAQVVLLLTVEGDSDTRVDPIGSTASWGLNGVSLEDDTVLGPGIAIREGDSDWLLSAGAQGPNSLTLRDENESETTTLYLKKVAAGPPLEYDLRPGTSAIDLRFGTDASGQRLAEVNTKVLRAQTAIYERGRTPAMGDWTTYTPGLRFGASAMTLGNGTLYGKYAQVGSTVFYRVVLYIGSTTTFPTSGNLFLTLPVEASAGGLQGTFGPVNIIDASASTHYPSNLALLFSGTEVVGLLPSGLGFISDTSPITLATDDQILFTGFYEKA
jgi:hypothetical protein